MRYSHLFSKTRKSDPGHSTPRDGLVGSDSRSGEDSVNGRLLTQAGFISKQLSGVYSYLPLGLRVLRKIQNIIREEMDALGAQELLMPTLTQVSSWKQTGRDTLDILFRARGADEAEYILNPTHEEVVTPLMKQFVFSYRDLPVGVYQIQDKYRNEPRARSGLLRGREFSMKDLYSFHATQDDLDAYYEKVKEAYFKIYQRMGLGDRTVLTFATGGEFSKYSHEFQTLCDAGEDTIYLCEKCNVAVNKEIIHEQKTCPQCGNKKLAEKRAIEVGNIFKLGTRFSDAFKLTYRDVSDQEHAVLMGCYGLGPSRVMGTLVEVFNDSHGIIWPAAVSPFAVHLVGIDLTDSNVNKRATAVYERFRASSIPCLYDDRTDTSPGEKFADADLIGVPVRLIVSKKTGDKVEIKERTEKAGRLDNLETVIKTLRPS